MTGLIQSSRREERRRQACRELIAAAERMLRQGVPFTAITIAQLVAEAGTSRTRFYSYFDDRADLLLAWFDDMSDALAALDEPIYAVRDGATEAALRDAVRETVIAYSEHSVLLDAAIALARVDRGTREVVGAMMHRRAARLAAHIEQGQEEGWIDATLLPEPTAKWLTATAIRGYHQMTGDPRDPQIEAFAAHYAQYLWFVLYAPAAHA